MISDSVQDIVGFDVCRSMLEPTQQNGIFDVPVWTNLHWVCK